MPKPRPNSKRSARKVVSIPSDVVLSPQAEAPRGPLGQDRSVGKSSVRELTWAQFERMVQSLGKSVRQSYAPDAVVGVAHGGVFVGGALAKVLGCEFFPVRISRRSRDHARAGSPKLVGEMPKELKGRRVLVVDDVASSGDTLELAVTLATKVGAREVQTCTLLSRPEGYSPGYSALSTGDLVVFPWDYDLAVTGNLFEPAPSKPVPEKKPAKTAKAR